MAKSTIASRGMFGFYRGLSSMVYFAAPKASIRFGAFEFCSGLLTNADGGDKYGLGPVSAPPRPPGLLPHLILLCPIHLVPLCTGT